MGCCCRYRIRLSYIALISALLPLLSAHLSFIIGVFWGDLLPCIPYWRDCYSISAVGRGSPQAEFFKPTILSAALTMLIYWFGAYRWSAAFQPSAAKRRVLLAAGFVASLALIAYVVVLGEPGRISGTVRRTAVLVFFSFSGFLHLLIVHWLNSAQVRLHIWSQAIRIHTNMLQVLTIGLIICGFASLGIGYFWPPYSHWDNAFEWSYMVFLGGQFLTMAAIWHRLQVCLSSKWV